MDSLGHHKLYQQILSYLVKFSMCIVLLSENDIKDICNVFQPTTCVLDLLLLVFFKKYSCFLDYAFKLRSRFVCDIEFCQ